MDIREKLKQTRQRYLNNDIITLHARRVNYLHAQKESYPDLEKSIIARSRKWLDSITTSNRDSLVKEKQEIMTERGRLMELKTGDAFHDYLLESSYFLNTHHTISVKLISLEEIKENAQTRVLLIEQIKQNTKEYVGTFFPSHKRPGDDDMTSIISNVCKECGGCVIESSNSHTVCAECGIVEQTGFSRNALCNMNYNDIQDLTMTRSFTYRRLNHFRELLRQIQGRSNTRISEEVTKGLKQEFLKFRIKLADVTPRLVRKFLKKLGYTKYYEQSEGLAASLNRNYKPVFILPEHEETLCLLFVQLEQPFDQNKRFISRSRKNFFSYTYIFYKLNQLMGWDHYNITCKLLKSVKLIQQQDAFWGLVTSDLGWENTGRTFHFE